MVVGRHVCETSVRESEGGSQSAPLKNTVDHVISFSWSADKVSKLVIN